MGRGATRTPKARKKAATRRMAPKTASKRPAVFRQRGVVRAPRGKGSLKHVKWADIELEQLNPLFQRQFIVGQDIMIARVMLKRGSVVPEHSHINEQVTYILEGALKFTIE